VFRARLHATDGGDTAAARSELFAAAVFRLVVHRRPVRRSVLRRIVVVKIAAARPSRLPPLPNDYSFTCRRMSQVNRMPFWNKTSPPIE